MKEIYLDGTEKDNSVWLSSINAAIKSAKYFEIHCWNEETEWIEFALQYGALKESTWRYGKMTPFFNIFLDDTIFQSCHYGTEIYIEEK